MMTNLTGFANFSVSFEIIDFKKPGYAIVFALFFIILGLVSLCGNSLIIYTYTRYKNLRDSPANYYTLLLATINTALSLLSVRIGFNVFFKFRIDAVSQMYCNAEGTAVSFLHINIMMLTVLLLVERYTIVTGSKVEVCLMTSKHPYISSAIASTISFLLSIPPITEKVSDYNQMNVLYSCIFDYNTISTANKIYLLTMLGTIFFLPFICLCFCMVRIQQFLNQSLHTLKNFDRTTKLSRSSRTSRAGSQRSTLSSVKKGLPILTSNDVVVIRRLFIMVICYNISWVPISLLILLRIFSGFKAGPVLTAVAFLMGKTSCIHSSCMYVTHKQQQAVVGVIKRSIKEGSISSTARSSGKQTV